jgi:hypothetical protein
MTKIKKINGFYFFNIKIQINRQKEASVFEIE